MLSDDRQHYPWHYVEKYEGHFVQTDGQIEDSVECFPWHGKPLAMSLIYEITGKHRHHEYENEKAEIQYRAPHEEFG